MSSHGLGRARRVLRALAVQLGITCATLGAVELFLRAVNISFLRESHELTQTGGRGSREIGLFRHDPELGWSPIPNSTAIYVGSHPITVAHNSLGLRDIEHDHAPRPTVLFLGDSFVWGYDADADERFTEKLRPDPAGYRIVNAGVSGYGTDQEYLLLKRLWNAIEPNVVVLMFCVDTDRRDNTSNLRYDLHYKPYFMPTPDGDLQLGGVSVPRSRHAYFSDNPIAHNSWIARVAVSIYLHFRHPGVSVPDPTERLVGHIRTFVEARGAKFLVGLQYREPQMEAFLKAQKIPYTSFDGAERYPAQGQHWTAKGHELVASRIMALFTATGALEPNEATAALGRSR